MISNNTFLLTFRKLFVIKNLLYGNIINIIRRRYDLMKIGLD